MESGELLLLVCWHFG